MKLRKKIINFVIAGAIFLGVGGAAYGIAYHTGAESKIKNSVIGTYEKIQNGVVNGYQKVEDHFTGDFKPNN